jgi:predicted HAD superfamily Cof-like phosphohydrolase
VKTVTIAIQVEVPDDASGLDVTSKIYRAVGQEFPGRHVDASFSSQEHADVKAFDRRYLIPNATEPMWLDEAAMNFRRKFMQEELDEFWGAYLARDMKTAFDSLADLAWVTHGTGTMMGMPWGMVWREVVRANMEKERATGADDPRSKRHSALDVVKPEGWREADHSRSVGDGPWPVLNTNLAGIVTVEALEKGVVPDNRFSRESLAVYVPRPVPADVLASKGI